MARIVRPNFLHRPSPPRPPRRWKRRLGNYYDREALVVLAAFALFCAAFYAKENWYGAERPSPQLAEVEVVDGDTVRNDGRLYRLVGFNTPETGWRAKCSKERALASKATARLVQLVESGSIDLLRVACACPAGTEGTSALQCGPALR